MTVKNSDENHLDDEENIMPEIKEIEKFLKSNGWKRHPSIPMFWRKKGMQLNCFDAYNEETRRKE
jgi:hypothetical protein